MAAIIIYDRFAWVCHLFTYFEIETEPLFSTTTTHNRNATEKWEIAFFPLTVINLFLIGKPHR